MISSNSKSVKKVCFARKQRGFFDDGELLQIDTMMRNCAEVVYKIYDQQGLVSPIVGGLKLNISVLY